MFHFKKSFFVLLLSLGLFINSSVVFASFPDVAGGHVNFDAINYVQDRGIVNGYPDDSFKPDVTINRAEFTKIVIESNFDSEVIDNCIENNVAAGSSTVFFTDVAKNEWFAKYICVAKMNDIIGGYPDGTFKPANLINFAEAAKIIVKTFSGNVPASEPWYKSYVNNLAEDNAIPLTITGFENNISRGEMAEVIYRLLAEIKNKDSWKYSDIENGTASSGGTPSSEGTVASGGATVNANRSLFFGNPIVNMATDSFPVSMYDCFTDSCPKIPLWGEEWTLNTSNRPAFDVARDRIIYPSAAGVFQLEALDNDTGVSTSLGFENDYAVSYLPALYGDTLAAAVFKDGSEIIVKDDLSSGKITEIPSFKGHTSCSWPAVSPSEKVYGVCRDGMTWAILDESGHSYYSSEKSEEMDGIKSLVIDNKGIGYFVEDEGIMKIDFNTESVEEVMAGSEYKVASITVTPNAEYIAGKAYRGSDNWKIFVTNLSVSEFMVPGNFDSEPGIPVFGPYLVGSNERSKMQGEEGMGGDSVLGCSDSNDPRMAISIFLDSDDDVQRQACLTDSAKTNDDYLNYGKGIYDYVQVDEVSLIDSNSANIDVWFWDAIGADPVGHLFYMTKASGKWLINSIEPSGKSFI